MTVEVQSLNIESTLKLAGITFLFENVE